MADASAEANVGSVLVVDDEIANRMILKAILEPRGYRVLEAESGERALEVLDREKADVILLDVMMSGIDGVETCRRIRRRADWMQLPVVIITSLTDRDTRIRGKEAGCDDFLNKPVDDLELLARVHNLILVKIYRDQLERHNERLEALVAKRTAELRAALARLQKAK
ncbi:MAG: response regulator [Planctomycetota bacterium]